MIPETISHEQLYLEFTTNQLKAYLRSVAKQHTAKADRLQKALDELRAAEMKKIQGLKDANLDIAELLVNRLHAGKLDELFITDREIEDLRESAARIDTAARYLAKSTAGYRLIAESLEHYLEPGKRSSRGLLQGFHMARLRSDEVAESPSI